MLDRLSMAQAVGGILHKIEKRVDHLTKEDQTMSITSEQMMKDLPSMNEAVSRTTGRLDGETKQQFRATSARYLDVLANRIDLQQAQERGVAELTRTEVEKIAGASADALIVRAEALRMKEAREAVSARLLADRAAEAERREEAQPSIDPAYQTKLRAERAIVASSQQLAAREEREAGAAAKAERVLAVHPAQPLPQALICQTACNIGSVAF